MMLRPLLLLAAGLAVVAVMVPDFAARYLADPAPAVEMVRATEEDGDHDATPAGYRTAVLKADGRGHFIGTFTINGRKIDGLVDTGASLVAINLSTAEPLGITRSSLDFRHQVTTANGKTRAAAVNLARVEIDGIRVSDVGAMVLDDAALSGTLIGMSFLKALSSYQVAGREMRLTQ